MADASDTGDDDIDLGELFAMLWAHRLLIVLITAIVIFLGLLYSHAAKEIYTGEAVFQLKKGDTSALSLSSSSGGQTSGLAALAGLNGLADNGDVLFDRVTGRAFIRSIDDVVDLKGDPYFNNYDPDKPRPAWKTVVKWILGMPTAKLDTERVYEDNIVRNYRANVVVDKTDNGAYTVDVFHTDPDRAAQIANAIMDQIVTDTTQESETSQNNQLTYLSETLADTLREMDDAQTRLKDFAIKNSTLSIQSLAAGSVALDEVRNRLERTTDLRDAANAMLEAIKQGKATDATYQDLRKKYPIIDDVEFRRVLGLSEIISEFTWPAQDLLAAVAATLEDRRARVSQEKDRLEQQATAYANAAEKQAMLQREADVAGASYTVLIEQVKAQSLLAGYNGDTVQVFERAVPPLGASKPNRILVFALSLVLGAIVGSGAVLVMGMRKGVYFTSRAMASALGADTTASAARLKKLNGKSLKAIRAILDKTPLPALSAVAIRLRGEASGVALAVDGKARTTARSCALGAATAIANSGSKIAFVDLSRRTSATSPAGNEGEGRYWAEIETEENVTEYGFIPGRSNTDLLSSPDFDAAVKALSDRGKLVVFSAESPIAGTCAAGLAGLHPTILLPGKPGRTAKTLIEKLRSLKLPTILLLE